MLKAPISIDSVQKASYVISLDCHTDPLSEVSVSSLVIWRFDLKFLYEKQSLSLRTPRFEHLNSIWKKILTVIECCTVLLLERFGRLFYIITCIHICTVKQVDVDPLSYWGASDFCRAILTLTVGHGCFGQLYILT